MEKDSRFRPCYEPPEFREHPEIEIGIEEAKEKYGIKLERGKFYSRQHALDFCKFIRQGNWSERLLSLGTFLGSCAGFFGLASLIPYHTDNLLGVLEFYATGFITCIGSIAITDSLLPLYERINSKFFNRNYKRYCEENNIPYDR